MSPKLAFAFVALIVALFVFGIGAGLTRNDTAGGDTSPGWTEWVGDRLGLSRGLSPEDIGATTPSGCRQQLLTGHLTLPGGTRCVFLVKESSSTLPAMRTFSLRVDGGSAAVLLRQREAVTIKKTLDSSEPESEFNVQREGATVEVACVAPPAATCGLGISF